MNHSVNLYLVSWHHLFKEYLKSRLVALSSFHYLNFNQSYKIITRVQRQCYNFLSTKFDQYIRIYCMLLHYLGCGFISWCLINKKIWLHLLRNEKQTQTHKKNDKIVRKKIYIKKKKKKVHWFADNVMPIFDWHYGENSSFHEKAKLFLFWEQKNIKRIGCSKFVEREREKKRKEIQHLQASLLNWKRWLEKGIFGNDKWWKKAAKKRSNDICWS